MTKFFSTTPETDVAEYYIEGLGNYVRSDISRKLERERDEANTKLQEVSSKLADALRERDEARDQLIHLRSCVYDVIHSLKAGAFDELEKAWKEGLK